MRRNGPAIFRLPLYNSMALNQGFISAIISNKSFIGKKKQPFIKTTVSCFTIKLEMMEGQNEVLTKIPERERERKGEREYKNNRKMDSIKTTASYHLTSMLCLFTSHIEVLTIQWVGSRLHTYHFFPHCLLKQPTSASSSINLWLRLIFTGISASTANSQSSTYRSYDESKDSNSKHVLSMKPQRVHFTADLNQKSYLIKRIHEDGQPWMSSLYFQ